MPSKPIISIETGIELVALCRRIVLVFSALLLFINILSTSHKFQQDSLVDTPKHCTVRINAPSNSTRRNDILQHQTTRNNDSGQFSHTRIDVNIARSGAGHATCQLGVANSTQTGSRTGNGPGDARGRPCVIPCDEAAEDEYARADGGAYADGYQIEEGEVSLELVVVAGARTVSRIDALVVVEIYGVIGRGWR